MVKQFLSQKGVDFEERDVSRSRQYAEELMKNTGQMGVPVTVIDREVIVGFDRPRLEKVISGMRPSKKAEPVNEKPTFGASVADAATITAQKGIDKKDGAYVGKVRNGSVADKLGLIPGDIIVSYNGTPVSNAAVLVRLCGGISRGNRVTVSFLRGNRTIDAQTVV